MYPGKQPHLVPPAPHYHDEAIIHLVSAAVFYSLDHLNHAAPARELLDRPPPVQSLYDVVALHRPIKVEPSPRLRRLFAPFAAVRGRIPVPAAASVEKPA